ncbi:MAG: dihydroorotate dehydrogenase electron transfer subunit [Magnetococcales bacterium]|nr:dihydroorotate dehydrogenase electron transfer subunit [Magnetococcales bacterium]
MCKPADPHHISASVVFNQPLSENKYLLRLLAPEVVKRTRPGHFIHLNCHPSLTLPRPFSIMDADSGLGTLDVFYQVVGEGTEYMSRWQAGSKTTLLGPVGVPFEHPGKSTYALLIAGGIGYAPLDFLARQLKKSGIELTLLLGMESQDPPFELTSGHTPLPHDPVANPKALARQEFLGIPSRLASLIPQPGFFQGYVTQLATEILQNMNEETRQRTRIYTCGPTPMMVAAAKVAKQFNLSGQVSLEEFMACGFGGCAGCIAPIQDSDETWSYRRVCTDGPVFSMDAVRWDQI